ncbi:hypothetical protein [Bradyrhizobium elkanii]|uniref:hypothetical protein n=1 Tax=Bradyrhizobium elkanii TaxID=29448 RepID=UPI003D2506D3
MGLLNYTTTIEAEQTISEIQKMLSRHGVSAMMTEYDGPQVASVSFRISVDGKPLGFRLPCNWRSVREIFRQEFRTAGSVKHKDKNLDNQAVRTSWRIMKVWIEAQLALVEVNMVTVPQVFLPYAIMRDGKTLSEHVETNPGFLLGQSSDV